MTARVVPPHRLLALGVLGLAALTGAMAGLSPKYAVAAALGLVYVVLVLQSLELGLAVFVVLTFLESISAFSGLSLAKAAGGLLAFSWLARIATRDRGEERRFAADHPALSAALIALGAWAMVSVLWAERTDMALGDGQRWVLNLVLFPIVYTAVRDRRAVHWIFGLFIVGGLLSAAAGIAGGVDTAGADAGRLEGSGVNSNELGELLIVIVIIGAALGALRDLRPPARGLAFAGAGFGIIALLLTVSRGAIVGLLVALLVAPVLAGPGRRVGATAFVALALFGGVVYLGVFAPQARERITQSDTTGSGRTDIWKLGLRIVADKPLLGVGAGNYANSTVHYLLEPGTVRRSDYIVDDPKAAHNVYLQVQAELGAVGSLLFAGILAAVLWGLLDAARRFAEVGERSLELLSRALLIALCGLLAALFFSTAVYSKQLWLLLGTGVALRALAVEVSRR
jgi:O-antigen ligase